MFFLKPIAGLNESGGLFGLFGCKASRLSKFFSKHLQIPIAATVSGRTLRRQVLFPIQTYPNSMDTNCIGCHDAGQGPRTLGGQDPEGMLLREAKDNPDGKYGALQMNFMIVI